MLRGFDYGLLAALGVALAHAVAWSVVGLTTGLLVIGIAGGWLIGYAVKQGVAAHRTRQLADRSPAQLADDEVYGRPVHRPPRGMPLLAAALGVAAWIAGTFVAFAIVQLRTGQGDLLARLSPLNFAAFVGSLMEPPLLQLLVIAAYVGVAWFTARPGAPRPAAAQR